MAKDVSEVIMGALSPLAVKGAIKLVRGGSVDKVAGAVKAPGRAADDVASGGLGEKLGHTLKAAPAKLVKDAVSSVSPSGGPGGPVMGALKNALPFGGDDEEQASDDTLGVGKGRRMPVQQSIEVAVPIETAYNQWTQYDLWPRSCTGRTRWSECRPPHYRCSLRISS